MGQLLVVDGYNIIHALPSFRRFLDPKLAKARAALLRSLGQMPAVKRGTVEVHVFFDAPGGRDIFDEEPLVAGVDVHFSDGFPADESIIDFVEMAENKSLITVVTDDRSLARRAGDVGAQTISSAGLENRLARGN